MKKHGLHVHANELHRVSEKNCAKLFLSELCQMSNCPSILITFGR